MFLKGIQTCTMSGNRLYNLRHLLHIVQIDYQDEKNSKNIRLHLCEANQIVNVKYDCDYEKNKIKKASRWLARHQKAKLR